MSDISELLERYRRGPEVIATLMTGAAGAELDFRSAPERWTLRQIVAHLADSELVGADRFRRVIAEDNPTLIGYDQNAWAANLNYAKRKTSESVEMFRRLRADCYELLKDLPPETFERQGNHSEAGPLTLRQLVQRMADHAESHARQIQQVRDAYRQARQAHA
ncbi:MAG TPA: DinB family protein [Bryobacteraceae bacterium]|nr:DinB family protein [Bryobacteraceae bacterium]